MSYSHFDRMKSFLLTLAIFLLFLFRVFQKLVETYKVSDNCHIFYIY